MSIWGVSMGMKLNRVTSVHSLPLGMHGSPRLCREVVLCWSKLLGMQGITISEGGFCVGGNSMIQFGLAKQNVQATEYAFLFGPMPLFCPCSHNPSALGSCSQHSKQKEDQQRKGGILRSSEMTQYSPIISPLGDIRSTAKRRREQKLRSGTQLSPLITDLWDGHGKVISGMLFQLWRPAHFAARPISGAQCVAEHCSHTYCVALVIQRDSLLQLR